MSPSEALERARSIVAELRALGPEADRLRRVPDASIALVTRNQLTRTIQPRACGGHELPLRSHVDVISTLAEGCGATAWVTGVCHAHSWLLGHFPRSAQEAVYGDDPDTIVSAVIGPRGTATLRSDGSYELTGKWSFASGCEHAAWLLLGAQLFDASGAKLDDVDLLVPASAVTIHDDWFAAGLAGTGSCSVSVDRLAVPAGRALSISKLIEGALPASKAEAVPVLGLCIATGALGIARAAVGAFPAAVRNKPVQYTGHIGHEWIPNQVALGHGASLVHAAGLVLYRVADDIDGYAARNERMPAELRGRIRMDLSLAVRMCLDAVERLYTNAGGSALSLSSPLQRAARDLQATNMHGLLLLETSAEIYGRILFGLGSNSPIY